MLKSWRTKPILAKNTLFEAQILSYRAEKHGLWNENAHRDRHQRPGAFKRKSASVKQARNGSIANVTVMNRSWILINKNGVFFPLVIIVEGLIDRHGQFLISLTGWVSDFEITWAGMFFYQKWLPLVLQEFYSKTLFTSVLPLASKLNRLENNLSAPKVGPCCFVVVWTVGLFDRSFSAAFSQSVIKWKYFDGFCLFCLENLWQCRAAHRIIAHVAGRPPSAQ